MWKDFKTFLVKQNAIGLAMAVVLGAALNSVVQAIVNDLVMPVITVAMPKDASWQTKLVEVGPFSFPIGHLAAAALNFLIIGFVVWRISKMITKEGPPPRTCQYCKQPVDQLATRCPHCTSQLA